MHVRLTFQAHFVPFVCLTRQSSVDLSLWYSCHSLWPVQLLVCQIMGTTKTHLFIPFLRFFNHQSLYSLFYSKTHDFIHSSTYSFIHCHAFSIALTIKIEIKNNAGSHSLIRESVSYTKKKKRPRLLTLAWRTNGQTGGREIAKRNDMDWTKRRIHPHPASPTSGYRLEWIRDYMHVCMNVPSPMPNFPWTNNRVMSSHKSPSEAWGSFDNEHNADLQSVWECLAACLSVCLCILFENVYQYVWNVSRLCCLLLIHVHDLFHCT